MICFLACFWGWACHRLSPSQLCSVPEQCTPSCPAFLQSGGPAPATARCTPWCLHPRAASQPSTATSCRCWGSSSVRVCSTPCTQQEHATLFSIFLQPVPVCRCLCHCRAGGQVPLRPAAAAPLPAAAPAAPAAAAAEGARRSSTCSSCCWPWGCCSSRPRRAGWCTARRRRSGCCRQAGLGAAALPGRAAAAAAAGAPSGGGACGCPLG